MSCTSCGMQQVVHVFDCTRIYKHFHSTDSAVSHSSAYDHNSLTMVSPLAICCLWVQCALVWPRSDITHFHGPGTWQVAATTVKQVLLYRQNVYIQ